MIPLAGCPSSLSAPWNPNLDYLKAEDSPLDYEAPPFDYQHSPASYIFTEDGQHFLFEDDQLNLFSRIPTDLLNGFSVIYTLGMDSRKAIWFQGVLYPDYTAFSQVLPPESHDKELLWIIAKVTTYFATEPPHKVLPGSPKEEDGGKTLKFIVEDEKKSVHPVEVRNYRSGSLGSLSYDEREVPPEPAEPPLGEKG